MSTPEVLDLVVLLLCFLLASHIILAAFSRFQFRGINRKLDLILLNQHGSLTPQERSIVRGATDRLRSTSEVLNDAVENNTPQS